MIASKVQNSNFGRVLNFGIKEVMEASKIQNLAAAAANLFNFELWY